MLKHLKLDNFLLEVHLKKILDTLKDVNLSNAKLTSSGSAKKRKNNLQSLLSTSGLK